MGDLNSSLLIGFEKLQNQLQSNRRIMQPEKHQSLAVDGFGWP